MKILTTIGVLLVSFSVNAAVTNITIKATTEIAGVATNNATIKFQQDGSNRDALTVDSLVWRWTTYKESGVYTNDFDTWLKDTAKTAFQSHNAERSADVLGAAAAKLAAAASTDSSLLTTQQKNQILAIAASLP